jgi:NAD(P)-dependent dehydrogenase (short-subunit alcohol dehydrogenase family)
MEVKCRRLEGKVAVVTASTQGIGLAIAERLGLEGAAVVISSRKQVLQRPFIVSLALLCLLDVPSPRFFP